MGTTLLFLFLFLAINFLSYSLGSLIVLRNTQSLLKYVKVNVKSLRSFFVFYHIRPSMDAFRINFEFAFAYILITLFDFEFVVKQNILSIIAVFATIYNTYSIVMYYFFKRSPMWKSDIKFAKVGLLIAKEKKYLIYFSLFVLIIGLYFIFWSLISYLLLFETNDGIKLMFAWLPVLLFFTYYKVEKVSYAAYYKKTHISIFHHIFKNINKSNSFKRYYNLNEDNLKSKNIYSEAEFLLKPNFYFISVESYGSICFKNKEIYEAIEDDIERNEELLKSKDYCIASIFSNPPQFAGGSWLSAATLLYGSKIADDTLYEVLFKDNKSFSKYESILHVLKNNGYKNKLLCPIGGYEDKIDWAMLRDVFQADEFYDWNKIDYKGKPFTFLGKADVPPDQYSINKAKAIAERDKPYTIFFSTLNSHCNFHSPIEVAENWDQDYKEIERTENNILIPKLSNYTKAIKYQLAYLTEFITKQNDDSIFILFGDHQPPYITQEAYGVSTPVHIISKNENLLDAFYKQDFTRNFDLSTCDKTINHESIYSRLMNALHMAMLIKNKRTEIKPNGEEF